MADSKNDPKNSRVTDKNDEKPTGYKSGGGNMGAGKSGKENLGSEKPTDDENMGSQKPGDGSKKLGGPMAREKNYGQIWKGIEGKALM